MILPGNDANSIAAAARCIRAGGLLGLPTETVYGLAADADNDAAVAAIFKAKGRPADHPLIVHVAGAQAASHYASSIPDFASALMAAFWPGPLTVILPRRPGIASAAAGGHPTIGLRCPAHPVALALLNWGQSRINFEKSEFPKKEFASDPNYFLWGLAAPSANLFGRVSPTTAAHVRGEFGADLLILDGGACRVGIESTIIDCTRGQPVLLRPGAITAAQVQAVCGLPVLPKEALAAPAPKASGTLESHYAPRARLRLLDAPALQQSLDAMPLAPLGPVPDASGAAEVLGPLLAVWSRTGAGIIPANGQVLHQTMPGDAVCAAQQLFAQLRSFDAQGVAEIWIETPPATPDWDGVRDRLQRAAH